MGFCNNCRKEIELNFDLHAIHCSKHLQLCPKCEEPVPRSALDQHIQNDHKRVICSNGCGKTFEQFEEQNHLSDECKNRLRQCKYCEIETTMANIFEHENICGSRTELCPYCDKYIVIKKFAEHEEIHLDWKSTNREKKDRVSNPMKLTQPDNCESVLQEGFKDLTKNKATSHHGRLSVNSAIEVSRVTAPQSNENTADPYNKAITQSKVAGFNKSNLIEQSSAQTSTKTEAKALIENVFRKKEVIPPEKIRGGAKLCRGIDAMDTYSSLGSPCGNFFVTPTKSDTQDELFMSHASKDPEDKYIEVRGRLKAFYSSSSYDQSQNLRKHEPSESNFMIRNESDKLPNMLQGSNIEKNAPNSLQNTDQEQDFSHSSYEEAKNYERNKTTLTNMQNDKLKKYNNETQRPMPNRSKDYRLENLSDNLASKTCNLDKDLEVDLVTCNLVTPRCKTDTDASRSIFDVESTNDELTMILKAMGVPIYNGMSKIEKDDLFANLLSEQELVEYSKKEKNNDTLRVPTRPWLEGSTFRSDKPFEGLLQAEKRQQSFSYEENLSETRQKNIPEKHLNGLVMRQEAYNGILDSEDDNISNTDQSEFSSSSDEENSPISTELTKEDTKRDINPTINRDVQIQSTGASVGSRKIGVERLDRYAIGRINDDGDKPMKTIDGSDVYPTDPRNENGCIACEKCMKEVPFKNYTTHLAMCPGPKPPKPTRPKRNISPKFEFMAHRNKWLDDNKPITCPFCEANVLSNNIFTHSAICRKEKKLIEERNVSCKHCGERINSKKIQSHQETCKNNMAKNSDLNGEFVPCDFCQQLVEFSRIESHEVFCSSSQRGTRGQGRGRHSKSKVSTNPRYTMKNGEGSTRGYHRQREASRSYDENDSYETVNVRHPFGGRQQQGLCQQHRPTLPNRGSPTYDENGGYETASVPRSFGSRQPSGLGQHSWSSPPGRESMNRNDDRTERNYSQTAQNQCPPNQERGNSSSLRGRGEGTRYINRRGRRSSPLKSSVDPNRYY